MSTQERGSLGGRAAQSRLTPEQRRAQMVKVRRSAHVKAIVDGWPELTPEQQARIRAVAARP